MMLSSRCACADAQCAVALDGELIKKIPCGYVKIAIETGYLVR
jgi:hypothetical protein